MLRVATLRRARVRVGPARRAGRRRRDHRRRGRRASSRVRTPTGWDPLEAALLRAVDELLADAVVSDATWATLAEHLDTQQLMDVVFTVGAYEIVAMAFKSFGVELDADLLGGNGLLRSGDPCYRQPRDPTGRGNEMAHFPKPAEGSWTEHYPELGTGPVSYEDSISPGVLRARARGDLPPLVAERRPRRAAPPDGQLLHQGARRRPHLGRRRARHRRRGPRLPQHLPPPRQQARVERLPAGGGRAAPAASSPASTTAGATTSRATLTFVQQEEEFFDLDKADYGLVPVQVEVWEGFIFVNLDPDNTESVASYLGELGAGIAGYPFGEMTAGLQVPRRRRGQLEALHRRLRRVLPRTRSAREAGGGRGVEQAPGLRLRGARLRASTARTAWCRRGAACRRPRTSTW